jgi:hypothetical protein
MVFTILFIYHKSVFQMWCSHILYVRQGLSHRFYNHMYGYGYVILFSHFLIHTAWWWLLYAAERCGFFGFAIIKVVYWWISFILLQVTLTQWGYHTLRWYEKVLFYDLYCLGNVVLMLCNMVLRRSSTGMLLV